jgi:hypothetical protein
MAGLVQKPQVGLDVIDEALRSLEEKFRDNPFRRERTRETLPEILGQARQLKERMPKTQPVRIVRQFACTGGTLICKALQAQPNTLLLSEVDPLNVAHRARVKPAFAPTDLIQLADTPARPLSDALKVDMFIAALTALHKGASREGRRLVLREHTHGRFCTSADWSQRPSLADVIAPMLPVVSVVTVRHPLDSWLSLERNQWRHFAPFTLEEYSRRYLAFLDTATYDPVFHYEAFVDQPAAQLERLCERLQLPVNPDWLALLPAIRLSGDSGRSSDQIQPRSRRQLTRDTEAGIADSECYPQLCQRLGYDPDPGAPVFREAETSEGSQQGRE